MQDRAACEWVLPCSVNDVYSARNPQRGWGDCLVVRQAGSPGWGRTAYASFCEKQTSRLPGEKLITFLYVFAPKTIVVFFLLLSSVPSRAMFTVAMQDAWVAHAVRFSPQHLRLLRPNVGIVAGALFFHC